MHENKWKRWPAAIWQASFLLLGATWLAAPYLNDTLSRRITLISQYELPVEPYSWFFRMGDILAAMLLLLTVYHLHRRHGTDNDLPSWPYYLLMAIGVGLLIDPVFTAGCKIGDLDCLASPSLNLVVHASETALSALFILILSCYDAYRNRNQPSTFFVVFQILYALLFISNLAVRYRFGTLSQIVYQMLTIVWLAWYVGTYLWPVEEPRYTPAQARNVRRIFAFWAWANGTLAILLSLLHIHLLGFIRNIYFAGNTAWLAQHGVIVGVCMLYLSRHLARGEHRARVLFLVLLFIEVVKYAAVTPDLDLLALYGITFAALYALRPFFKRGSVSPDWHLRLQEAALVLSGVGMAAVIVAFLISRSQRLYNIASDTFNDFHGASTNAGKHINHHIPHGILRSSLLAHTMTALAVVTALFLLWSLFRPARAPRQRRSTHDREAAQALLQHYAVSSEDFFKIWPHDKYYFWSSDRQSFVAYTLVDNLAFALADPVGPTQVARRDILQQFVRHWHGRGYISCFLLVSKSSLPMFEAAGLRPFQIGSSAVIDVRDFMENVVNDKWWRWQRNRSRKAGYEYHVSQAPHSTEIMRQCQTVSDSWLSRPGHRERGFALGIFNKAYLDQCTLHYLTDESGTVVAFTNQVPTFNNLNQATVDMMRFLPDANNAMPYLLANVISSLAEDPQYERFDLGFVPMAKMDNPLIAIAKTVASRQISAAGLEQFKGKFKPHWQKNYLVYDGDLADLATIAIRVEEAMYPK